MIHRVTQYVIPCVLTFIFPSVFKTIRLRWAAETIGISVGYIVVVVFVVVCIFIIALVVKWYQCEVPELLVGGSGLVTGMHHLVLGLNSLLHG